jgi:predicted nucleic acid-binding protein
MTVVVADTSPLNYLILIGEASILPELYTEIFIPDVVAAELCDPEAPEPVRKWAAHPPSWLNIRPWPNVQQARYRLNSLSDSMMASARPFFWLRYSRRLSFC